MPIWALRDPIIFELRANVPNVVLADMHKARVGAGIFHDRRTCIMDEALALCPDATSFGKFAKAY